MRGWIVSLLVQAGLACGLAVAAPMSSGDITALTGEWRLAGGLKADCRLTFGHEMGEGIEALKVDFASGPTECFTALSDIRYWRPESADRFDLLDKDGRVLMVFQRANSRSTTFTAGKSRIRLIRLGYSEAQT